MEFAHCIPGHPPLLLELLAMLVQLLVDEYILLTGTYLEGFVVEGT